ncbi:helix-turn-helix domain-containing protein [Rhodococcus sp. 14-2470-1a]|uniref:helix-turn-helix domain-containing protein n=1 Tax=Rhodococcus sp. 14-2470-1a TaxID=2023150 RepID=UPI000B9A36CA|nr:helix-turn-helix domain-containing protein [Rhodococcus sp. 14-2470-1a]OZF44280.1 hypothetical protein CH292_24600 [Rhodococcus sp. 14-2470-1a]
MPTTRSRSSSAGSEYFSIQEVAERVGKHERTIRGYIEEGRLKAYRVGPRGRYRIKPADVEAMFSTEPKAVETTDDVADHVARVLASAPPLTDAQRDRITSLLRTGSVPNRTVSVGDS